MNPIPAIRIRSRDGRYLANGDENLAMILAPSFSPAMRPSNCPMLRAMGKRRVFWPMRALHRISPTESSVRAMDRRTDSRGSIRPD